MTLEDAESIIKSLCVLNLPGDGIRFREEIAIRHINTISQVVATYSSSGCLCEIPTNSSWLLSISIRRGLIYAFDS